MQCSHCGLTNPPGVSACRGCGAPLPRNNPADKITTGNSAAPNESPDATLTSGAYSPGPAPSVSGPAVPVGVPATIHVGQVLGNRYEILQLLGEGGMGAVYKALDRELGRPVALKVIRPDLATRPEILERFKRELILARKVTHKNVIRIFDLGEADGIKFITMDFIEGRDLHALLRQRGKFPPEEAVNIISQVCRALDAAHAEGVIHRDLKPKNIMVDDRDRVTVMDFGIARSVEMRGVTLTGALIGTPDYMSPEQAKGLDVDARSDLFSLGIIFYELLTGQMPYEADTAVGVILKRLQERPRPPIELDPSIPPAINAVVVKCLEMDRERRYLSAAAILRDLGQQTLTLPEPPFSVSRAQLWMRNVARHRKWLASGFGLLVLAAVLFLLRGKFHAGAELKGGSPGPAVTLAILPFRNTSGDHALDWLGESLADMLSTGVGQSNRLRTVSSDRLHQILRDLQVSSNAEFDPDTLRRLAEFSSADTLVWGQFAKFGDQIRIDATLQDLKRNRRVPLKIEAASEKEIPATVDRLAEIIRQNLAVSSDVLKELKANSFEPTSKSVAALRSYDQGVQFLRDGKWMDAAKTLQTATKEDPEFALAYARLAEAESLLGYDADAEKDSRKAVDLSQNLPPQEKYRIAAGHARIMKDYPKAIASYENLAKAAPGDTDVQYTLGTIYEDTGAYQKAREHYAAVLKADPQSVETLWKMGGVEIMSDNPQGSLDYLNRGLTLSIQLGNDEKKAVILQAIGIAYRLMNKPEEALRNYQEALVIERRIGFKRGVAASLNEMGQVYSLLGKPDAALASFNEAIQVRREIGAKKEAGDTLIDLGNFYEDRGQHDHALQMFMESLQIQRDSGDETYQALCLNNIGSVYLTTGRYDDALTYFQQALQLREKLKVPGEIVETVYNLGETNTKLGRYDQALSQYLRALDLYRSGGDKRGAATAAYSIGSLFAYEGRYGAALNSEEEALKTFRELNDRSPTMADILTGYGRALALAGRGEEAQKTLDEALNLARELKSQPLVAQALNFQGDSAFYRGDFKSARTLYGQGLQAALHTKDRAKVLESKIGLAKVAIREGRSREALTSFKSLAQEADSLGLKYLSVECSVDLGEALVNAKDYSRARQELEPALGKAEKLGLRALLARDHYVLATALRATGNGTEATGHYHEVVRLLDEIRKEAGAEKVIERADLKPIYTESTRWSQGGTM